MSSEIGTDSRSGNRLSRLRFAPLGMTSALDHKIAIYFPKHDDIVGDVFPHIHFKNSRTAPLDPLLTVTRTTIGLGLGLLVADKIEPSIRQAAAVTLVAIGALAATPWLVKMTVGRLIARNGAPAPVCVGFAAIPVTASDNDIY